MKKVRTDKAIGKTLAHDMTKVVPGKFKGARFKKGYVIKKDDIEELLAMGKEYVYIIEHLPNEIHEDEAAIRLAKAFCGPGLKFSSPSEGKVTVRTTYKGLLKVQPKLLYKINSTGKIIVSTLKTNTPCVENQMVAATRIIPLTISYKNLHKAIDLLESNFPLIQVLPYKKFKVGAIVTGSEIKKGLIKDEFYRFVGKKFKEFGSEIIEKLLVNDDPEEISNAILKLKSLGADLIVTTGGLSVDPDDVTKTGIRKAGARIIIYGSPILPGAMFLYAVLDSIPILGLPACVYYHKTTIFDLVLPKVLAGEEIKKSDIIKLGHGGLCLNCRVCHYPICPFGK